MIKPFLYIGKSGRRGNGIFTREDIPARTIVEVAPVIELSVKEGQRILSTKLSNYVYKWGESARKIGIAMGWASFYNHSYRSNCQYYPNFKKNLLTIKTVRAVKKGEELFVNYNSTWNDDTPVWFNVK